MKGSSIRLALATVAVGLLPATAANAQDFQRSFPIGAGGSIAVKNVSGNIRVTGSNGNAVVVNAWKEGPDRDLAEIEDQSGPNQVDLRVRYPERCNCDASVRIEVQVPRSINYEFNPISSVSGDVEVSGVSGQIRAKSVSGNVRVKDIIGAVSASSVSGNVDTLVSRLEGSGDMKFSSVSGNVEVKVPGNLDAQIEMSTMSGSLRTEFPIEVHEKRHGPGQSASGRVGAGARKRSITSVSGNVTLAHQ